LKKGRTLIKGGSREGWEKSEKSRKKNRLWGRKALKGKKERVTGGGVGGVGESHRSGKGWRGSQSKEAKRSWSYPVRGEFSMVGTGKRDRIGGSAQAQDRYPGPGKRLRKTKDRERGYETNEI